MTHENYFKVPAKETNTTTVKIRRKIPNTIY